VCVVCKLSVHVCKLSVHVCVCVLCVKEREGKGVLYVNWSVCHFKVRPFISSSRYL